MKFFTFNSITTKLCVCFVLSAALMLSLTCAGFVFHDSLVLRQSKVQQLRTQAELLAYNLEAAIRVNDADGCRSLLRALESQPTIEHAWVLNIRDDVLAAYSAWETTDTDAELVSRLLPSVDSKTHFELRLPIRNRGEMLGTLVLRSNLSDVNEQIENYYDVAQKVFLSSLAISLLFAHLLHRTIVAPILTLAGVARQITDKNDYSQRVPVKSRDEVGFLCTTLNRMLDQIASSRIELEKSNERLEERVVQRTKELSDEIARREKTSQELIEAKNAAESANRAKSDFLANMSHEIRTPLNAILGFADLLRKGACDSSEEERDFLDMIHNSGHHLLMVINDILDISKIEAHKMELEEIPFSPDQVVVEVISSLAKRAEEQELSLDYRWSGPIPQTITSDPLRFRQIVTNLVANAIKFTERGQVGVRLRLDTDGSEPLLAVIVSDTGIGISQDKIDSIFNPFGQADSSITRRFGGTGLGLPICRHFAEAMGGNISVSSEPGCGSTFTARITTGSLAGVEMLTHRPCQQHASTNGNSTFPEMTQQDLSGKKLLVVEDGETNRKLMSISLGRFGAEVHFATNGEEGVQAAQAESFDAVLMDMQMPVMDGYTAVRILREQGLKIPIFALTAHAMKEDRQKCMEVGCSDYVSKPVDFQLLIQKLADLKSNDQRDDAPVIESISGQETVVSNFDDGDSMTAQRDPIHSSLESLNDPEFNEILIDFGERLAVRLVEIREAFQQQQFDTVREIGHWLKGTGGSVGFDCLTRLGAELELSAKAGEPSRIAGAIGDLERHQGRLVFPQMV